MLFPSNQIETDSSSSIEPQLSFSTAGGSNFDSIFNNSMCTQTKTMASSDHANPALFQHRPQQSVLDSNERTEWQTSSDIPDRLRTLASVRSIVIQKMFKSPNAVYMVHKLPIMSRKMEEILYRAAHSKQEYLDFSTLEARLAMIASALEETTGALGVASAHQHQQQQLQQQLLQQQHRHSVFPMESSNAFATSAAHSRSGASTLAVPWQSPADQQDRLSMMTYIRQIVKKQIVQGNERPAEVLKKLPKVSKMMEMALYKSAPTKADYMDLSTLKDRLQAITDELLSGRQHRQSSVAV